MAAAEQSMGAAVVLAEQLPDGAEVLAVAQQAFLSGFGAGSLVAAAATAAGADMALIWLPARA